ncbi:MAG: LptF/LptG family permease, partial [Hyphomicrobiales bacterium]|nr:LptF/LptG family permease [Hyphomicrobiales bacterium]
SAWTLALPGFVVAAFTGVLLAVAFDPLAAWSNRTENAIESRLFAAEAAPTDGRTFWLRQAKPDAIVRARYARPSEAALYGASFFLFAPDGGLERRIDASIATLRKGAWSLADATTYRAGEPPAKAAHLDLPTEIDPVALVQGVAEPRLVSFWGLPAASAAAGAAGLDPRPYLARFAGLAATPLALVAVTLLAAMNSMTISRGGFPAWRLAHGVLATFVLYVALKVGADFARSGFIGAAYAASVPSAVGCLAGVQGLLRREDG